MKVGEPIRLLRYPGGKQRFLKAIIEHLPSPQTIRGNFVEPFVGSAAVFFGVDPHKAVLSDINQDLIAFYQAIRYAPRKVWRQYAEFPSTKQDYYRIRGVDPSELDLVSKAARLLYLNRTCYKGMWRHNSRGQFNVGYGGQERRWVISEQNLIAASRKLRKAQLQTEDFETIVDRCSPDDFLFLDPPYKPGGRELVSEHYVFTRFGYENHQRLAHTLSWATDRGVRWALTTSSHPDILGLYRRQNSVGSRRESVRIFNGVTGYSGESIVCNYNGDSPK